jgi:hypothetical protein
MIRICTPDFRILCENPGRGKAIETRVHVRERISVHSEHQGRFIWQSSTGGWAAMGFL